MLLGISVHHPNAEKTTLGPLDFKDELLFFCAPNQSMTNRDCQKIIAAYLGEHVPTKMTETYSEALRCAQVCAGAAIVSSLVNKAAYPDVRFVSFEPLKSESAQCVFRRTDEDNPMILDLIDQLHCFTLEQQR